MDDDSDDVDMASVRTPLSERLRLESISVFYSKSIYPTSLGLYYDDDWFKVMVL